MPNGCCSNCFSKYSIFNPENGCSNCAFSFCKKCVGYRALVPNLADKPVSVCQNCYQKLTAKQIITTTSINPESANNKQSSSNWWGEGLPPPSFRQTIAAEKKDIRHSHAPKPSGTQGHETSANVDDDLHKRLHKLKEDRKGKSSLSVSEIEERLAALRGCDVELIRHPKTWISSSTSKAQQESPADLMKRAQNEVRIENDADERLERRFQEFKNDLQPFPNAQSDRENTDVHSEFIEASPEELEKIQRLLDDAEEKNKNEQQETQDEKAIRQEMKDVLEKTRQKSLEIQAVNDRINNEFTGFWDNQINKTINMEDSDDEQVDDEMLKKIIAEAEATPDAPAESKSNAVPTESPKKKGFFKKFFGR